MDMRWSGHGERSWALMRRTFLHGKERRVEERVRVDESVEEMLMEGRRCG